MGLMYLIGNQEDRENKQGRHRGYTEKDTEKDTEKESKQGEHREGRREGRREGLRENKQGHPDKLKHTKDVPQ